MNFLKLGPISRKLALLVLLAVSPAMIILLYSGMEQRQQSIENAKDNVFQLTHAMAKAQQEIANSAKQILSTLSLLPAIQTMDAQVCSEIFKAVIEQNPNYKNITLTDLNGDVVASGRAFTSANLADRKHVREALQKKDFAVGEYIVLRVGSAAPAFAFGYPVLDKQGTPTAVLTMAIKLANFADFHDTSKLPERSFVGITDHQGIRLFYYPSQHATNPIGKPIKAKSWKMASTAQDPGIFTNTGSDGQSRIFAFEQVRLSPEDPPYLYVWAGIPESHILSPANDALARNLLCMLIATIISFFISWVIGKKTETLIEKIERSSQEIKTLREILPICSFCKDIRNDDGYYEQLEGYIKKHSGIDFSHTICPTCMKEHYPEQYKNIGLDQKT